MIPIQIHLFQETAAVCLTAGTKDKTGEPIMDDLIVKSDGTNLVRSADVKMCREGFHL